MAYTSTHYDIQFARKFLLKYPGSLTIELIKDGQPNALVFYKDDLIESNKIFGKWFETVSKMKKEFPQKSLVKTRIHLSLIQMIRIGGVG